MFGNKRFRVSRPVIKPGDLSQAILKANERIKAETNAMKQSVRDSKDELKSVKSEIKQSNKELKRVTATIDSRISECNAIDSQIFSTKDGLAALTDRFKKELDIEESLHYSVNQLVKKESKLEKVVNKLEEKKSESGSIKASLKVAKQEYDQVKQDLSKLTSNIANVKKELHSFNISKDIVQEEYDKESSRLSILKLDISNEIKTMEMILQEKKEYFQSETARLDKLIADRIEELSDSTELVNHKNREYQMIATQVIAAENRIKNAEDKVKQILNNQQVQIERVKEQFKTWKLNQLDQVAKLKLKGKIENIDKVGLKDILDV